LLRAEGIEVSVSVVDQLLEKPWQHSQQQSTSWSQWNTYLNLSSQEQLLQYLQTHDFPQAQATHSLAQNLSQWHQVTGFAIDLDQVRLICIPSEAIDTSELLVPALWVDTPDRRCLFSQ
jgi:Protein of unknown function (DUF1822)